ncbi:MAG TPA: CaiB/BaiF CoA-transferase family protein [Nocardioidaceae bacterium]|jgi:formyl-CoA transferase|nr:CaiB/BaiF CoA-transferase family protein [Nocardioidaceae bacterium]
MIDPDTTAADPGQLPLHGVTVLSLEQAVAAPLATRHLADLGARVIKVERVDGGDFARAYDQAVNGIASHFVWLNRSKESIALDLKTGEGLAILHELISQADVVLQNLAPGAAERLGCAAADLRVRRPELIVVDMSGYGSAGPFRERKAYDMLVQAESGLISVTGTPEQPAKTGVPSADIAAGLYAFSAVLSAVIRRLRTGAGASIEVSMFDALVEWLGHPMYMAMYTGTQVPRMGLSHAAIAPYDAYPTKDGEILIGIQNDRGWRQLVTTVFDRLDLVDHPDYATNVLRCRNREPLDALMAELTSRFTSEELSARLNDAGVPAAQLNDLHAMIEHPQLAGRERWRTVGTEAGPVRAVLPPITYGDVEARMGDVPELGRDTDAVLGEIGYAEDRIARLRAAGVVR